MKTIEKIQKVDPRIVFFDNLSASWDDSHQTEQIINKLKQLNSQLLGFTKRLDVLEVGCGTGSITTWLVDKIYPGKVTAIDFAPKMIEKAKQKNIKAKFLCADICQANTLPDEFYDIIFCFHSFPHFRDKSLALNNIKNLLKPRGSLIVLHLQGSKQINEFHSSLASPVSEDYLPVSTKEWDNLLVAAGLKRMKFINKPDLFFLKAFCI